MKFASSIIAALVVADQVSAFAPLSPLRQSFRSGFTHRFVADVPTPPPPSNDGLPVVQQNSYGQPSDVRYSDFLKLVNGDRIEKVTFSSDGTQLLGVDVDGVRLKIEALPNDPDLLTQLTNHKVRFAFQRVICSGWNLCSHSPRTVDILQFQVDVTVLPAQQASGLGELAQSLIFPAILFAGLFFLSRRAGGGMGGPMGGGPGNPMGFGKAKSQIQMVPDTGVTFDDVAGCDGAKLELAEVVDFLKKPEAYTQNGCRIPRGVILDGPPGKCPFRTSAGLLLKHLHSTAPVNLTDVETIRDWKDSFGESSSRRSWSALHQYQWK